MTYVFRISEYILALAGRKELAMFAVPISLERRYKVEAVWMKIDELGYRPGILHGVHICILMNSVTQPDRVFCTGHIYVYNGDITRSKSDDQVK